MITTTLRRRPDFFSLELVERRRRIMLRQMRAILRTPHIPAQLVRQPGWGILEKVWHYEIPFSRLYLEESWTRTRSFGWDVRFHIRSSEKILIPLIPEKPSLEGLLHRLRLRDEQRTEGNDLVHLVSLEFAIRSAGLNRGWLIRKVWAFSLDQGITPPSASSYAASLGFAVDDLRPAGIL
jgi:hypothetical protein